jgi:signal transduction histidine kinase
LIVGRFVLQWAMLLAWMLIGDGPLSQTGKIDLVMTALLMVYTFWPNLPERLGRYFLPIGVILTLLCTLIAQSGLFDTWMSHLPVSRSGLLQMLRPIPMLVALSIIVIWQYDMRRLWMFNLSSIALDIALYLLFPQGTQPSVATFCGILMVRLSMIPVMGYMVRRVIDVQKEQRRVLAEANERLAQHALTLEHLAISRERNRLARELHDTLAHTLSALAVQLEAVRATWDRDPESARHQLDAALVATRAGLNESRRALHALRAAPIEEFGLIEALRRLAESMAERNGLSLELSLPERELELAPDVEQCVYRVAQEALENSVRHAEASKLCLRLCQTQRQLLLEISDDGVGFDPQTTTSQRLGVRGMYERAKLVGGHLSLTSQSGQGTQLTLTIGGAHDSRVDLR